MAKLTLEGADGDETRRVVSDDGFVALVPGHPTEVPSDVDGELRLRCAAMDIEVSYLIGDLEGDAKARELAIALAQARVANRAATGDDTQAQRMSPRPSAWRVDAAATAQYARGDREREDQLVLIQAEPTRRVAYRAIEFHRDKVTHITWAAFRAALSSGMSWGGEPAVTTLWPKASTFWEPGEPFKLRPEREYQVALIGERLSAATGDVAGALRTLLDLGKSDKAATTPVTDGERDAIRMMVVPRDVDGADAMTEGLAEVVTVHDLRGWAEQIIRALLWLESH